MRTLFFLLLLVFSASDVVGQLVPEQDSFFVEGLATEEKAEQVFSMLNDTSETTNFYWTIEVGPDFPSNWQLGLCDLITCLDPLVSYSSICSDVDSVSARNSFLPNSTYNLFSLKVIPNRTMGTHTVTWNFMKYCNEGSPSELIKSIDFTFNITGGVNTEEELVLSNSNIYPNPAQETFNIVNDKEVHTVQVYDMYGRSINKYKHNQNQNYPISDYDSGVYYVVLESRNQAKKTIRLVVN